MEYSAGSGSPADAKRRLSRREGSALLNVGLASSPPLAPAAGAAGAVPASLTLVETKKEAREGGTAPSSSSEEEEGEEEEDHGELDFGDVGEAGALYQRTLHRRTMARRTTNSRIVSRVARAAAQRRKSLLVAGANRRKQLAADGGGGGDGGAQWGRRVSAPLSRVSESWAMGSPEAGAEEAKFSQRVASGRVGARRGGSQQIVPMRRSASLPDQSEEQGEAGDSSGNEDDVDDQAVVLRALAMIQRLDVACCAANNADGTTAITKAHLNTILQGFELAFALGNDADTLKVEQEVRQRYKSMPDIFDSATIGFIDQNYGAGGAVQRRRTSLTTNKATMLVGGGMGGGMGERSRRGWGRRYSAVPVQGLDLAPEDAKGRPVPISVPLPTPEATTESACAEDDRGRYGVSMLVRSMVTPSNQDEALHMLDGLQQWSFDVFRFKELSPRGYFQTLGIAVLEAHDLFASLQLSQRVVSNWLLGMQQQYHDNPYHNATHAIDITQTLHHFLSVGGLGTHMPPHTILAAILAAVGHDCGHPGVNNNFLAATNDRLALQYSYRSPLENLHASLCFQTMAMQGCDVLGTTPALSAPVVRQVRETMVEMVLGTDNATHSVVMGRLKAKLDFSGSGVGMCMQEHSDQVLSLCVALHTADVSNPAKATPLYRSWTKRVLDEFYAQGDKERQRGMPISFGCDRENIIPEEKFQAGFIVALVRPLYREFSKVPGVCIDDALEQLEVNLSHWQKRLGRNAGQDAAARARADRFKSNVDALNAIKVR